MIISASGPVTTLSHRFGLRRSLLRGLYSLKSGSSASAGLPPGWIMEERFPGGCRVDRSAVLGSGSAAGARASPTRRRPRRRRRPACSGLPDLTVSGGPVPVDEPRALDLLQDAAVHPERAADLFPGRTPEVVSGSDAGRSGGSWFDAVRGFLSPGGRVDQAVSALEGAGLPSAVREALSDQLTEAFRPGAKLAEAELERVRLLLDLPWTKSQPQRFDREHVAQVLRGTHTALDGVHARILQFLGSCPEARDLLTFEGPCSCRRAQTEGLPALVARPGWAQERALRPLPCRSRGHRQDVARARDRGGSRSEVRERVPERGGDQAAASGVASPRPGLLEQVREEDSL